MSPKSLVSIATGAGLGVLGAVFLQMDPAEPADASAASPPAAVTASAVPPLESQPAPPTPVPAEPAVLTASQKSETIARPAANEPKTAAEVTRAEMACDARDKGGCIRAAIAYETGNVVPKNPELARTYRKRELTLVVRGCEARSPAACLTLSERYARGEGVEQSSLKSEALVRHAREICVLRPTAECADL
jgi:TPR repeat protein